MVGRELRAIIALHRQPPLRVPSHAGGPRVLIVHLAEVGFGLRDGEVVVAGLEAGEREEAFLVRDRGRGARPLRFRRGRRS